MSDPFRVLAPPSSEDDAAALLRTAPASRDFGREAVADMSRLTGSVLSGLKADDRRAFDRQRERVFGEAFSNRLTAEEATAEFGIEGRLKFDKPVNRNIAAWRRDEHQREMFNQEVAASADLSIADTIGASLGGSFTDPIQMPLFMLGGEGVLFRSVGGSVVSRGAAAARAAAVGALDGVTASVGLEVVDQTVKRAADREAPVGQSVANVGLGMIFGAGIGGVAGSLARPGASAAPRRVGKPAAVDGRVEAEARRRGFDPAVAVRIRQLENGSGDPQARPIKNGKRLSSAHGVFQITDGTWTGLGGGDRNDVGRQVELGIENLVREQAGLRQALGREPEGWEIYLAHQQGQGGARALLANPGRDAIAVMTEVLEKANPGRGAQLARKAVLDNGGREGMTAADFAGLWRAKFNADGAAPRSAAVLEPMTPNERAGSLLTAIDAVARDEPLDLGPLLARKGLAALDEADALPSVRGRFLENDVAVTRRGSEVPVRFAVVELQDLKTSHSDDLTPVADYPAVLQPRDRSRPGSQSENYQLEADLNPSLLMRDKSAGGGAPIISPAGLVESGNGRAIALRRSAATGTEAWSRYQTELKRQGIDTTGFDQPVLVRMRAEPMSGAERADLARELNRSSTEAYSPVEQARSDARRMDRDLLRAIEGNDVFAASNRPFTRGFMARVAEGDANALTDEAGALNLSGRARIQAALTHAAYGDDTLTAAVFETGDETIRAIGKALADAAPAWARMRADAPEGLDLTGNLVSAVNLVREGRRSSLGIKGWMETRLQQRDLFGGETVSPETETFLRLMFRDDAFSRPRAAGAIADGLRDYARRAADTPAGADLFGVVPDGRQFLATTLDYLRRLEGDGSRGLAYAGGAEPAWTGRSLADPVLDLRQPQPEGRDAGGQGVRPEGQPEPVDAGGGSGKRQKVVGPQPLPPEIAADPELRAILDDTEALAREAGIDVPDFEPADRPETWAAAIRAAAICLAG
ncbi:hypothetical protein [Brevundimonas sp. CEF1]|uniref:hypothetical protein n=1 Tax=Brevundimonas sp. CEF1 TaxID=3442642 RepID=UPI003F511309